MVGRRRMREQALCQGHCPLPVTDRRVRGSCQELCQAVCHIRIPGYDSMSFLQLPSGVRHAAQPIAAAGYVEMRRDVGGLGPENDVELGQGFLVRTLAVKAPRQVFTRPDVALVIAQ